MVRKTQKFQTILVFAIVLGQQALAVGLGNHVNPADIYVFDGGNNGCTDTSACNFDPNASIDDGSCIYPANACEVCDGAGGVISADADGDSVCDQDEIAGCLDSMACNFDPAATDSDGSCIYPNEQCEACDGAGGVEALDNDGDGVPNCEEVLGCTEPSACNFDPAATEYDFSCQDFELCGDCMDYSDFENSTCLELHSMPPGTYLCTDSTACNYSGCEISNALEFCPSSPSGLINYQINCIYPPGGLTCEEYGEFDSDGDGVFDIDEVTGCTYPQACNYAPWATDDSGNCMIPGPCEECTGHTVCTASIPPFCSVVHQIICAVDENMNLICDCEEDAGCTDELACNYDAEATLDDGSCSLPVAYRDCLGQCLNDTDGDEVCDEEETSGCTDETAINYDQDATDPDPCYYPEDFFDETCAEDLAILQGSIFNGEICGEGTIWSPVFQTCLPDPSCLGDLNADGVIGTADLLVLLSVFGDDCGITGCTVPYALNFNPDAEEDNWTCAIPGCSDALALNYLPGVNVPSNDNCIYGLVDSTGACLGIDQIHFNNYTYPLVEIGGHCWFKENLRTTSFRDGSDIFLVESGAVWGNQVSAAATAPGGLSMLGLNFGLLYNWHAVIDDRGLCPTDWYPADSLAWSEAISIAGGPDIGAPAMRVPGNQIIGDGVWEMNNEDATNITSFSALPAGYRLPNGNYGGLYSTGQFWGGESLGNTNARSYYINQSLSNVGITQNSKSLGLSVRCTRKPIVGCTDSIACNFNPSAEIDSGDCAILTTDDCGCVFCGDEVWNDSDQDGICDTNEISICADPLACNFVDSQCEQADNTVCVYPSNSCEDCDGNGSIFSSDSDGDGVCDPFLGCTNNVSLNFNPLATIDNGSCLTIPDSIDYCEYLTDTAYTTWIDEEEQYVWVHRISSETIENITGLEKFHSNPYAHNRLVQELYSVSADANSIYVLHLDTWSIEVRDVSGWEGNLPYNDLVYNPSDQKIYAVRSGLDRMNKVDFAGGVWELSTYGSFDSYRYGAKRFYNGIENVVGTHGGYGWYQSRRDVHFAVEPNYSLIIPNTSDVEPFKRTNHDILPSADFHAAFIMDGKGSSSGDQWQNSCDIPGGYDYATDIGDFCWLRDLWKFDFTTNEFQEILPVNTDFPARGTYGFDFDAERFWCFGGYLPQQAYGDYESENSNVFSLKLSDVESGWEQIEVHGDDFEFSRHGFSVYNPVSGNMVVFNDSGVWEMVSVSNEIEVTWAEGPEGLTSSSYDPNMPTFQELNVIVNGQIFTESIFVTPAELGCTIECAANYSPLACIDDDSCEFQGVFCPDIDSEQDFCEQWIECLNPTGCTDVDALNFDPQASIDDGSCEY